MFLTHTFPTPRPQTPNQKNRTTGSLHTESVSFTDLLLRSLMAAQTTTTERRHSSAFSWISVYLPSLFILSFVLMRLFPTWFQPVFNVQNMQIQSGWSWQPWRPHTHQHLFRTESPAVLWTKTLMCSTGPPLRGPRHQVVPLSSPAALSQQLHQSYRHVGRRLHLLWDAHWENAVCR